MKIIVHFVLPISSFTSSFSSSCSSFSSFCSPSSSSSSLAQGHVSITNGCHLPQMVTRNWVSLAETDTQIYCGFVEQYVEQADLLNRI